MSDPTEAAINRGQAAQDLLANPLVADAFRGLEANLMDAWRTSPARDTEGREHLYIMLRLLAQLEGVFQTWVQDGKIAADRLALSEADRRVNRA